MQSVQGVKDFAYTARIVFISPGDTATLEARLKESGRAETEIPDLLKAAEKEKEEATTSEGLYDIVIDDSDLETAYSALEAFIYGEKKETMNDVHEDATETNGENAADVTMAEAEPTPPTEEKEGSKAEESQPQTEASGV